MWWKRQSDTERLLQQLVSVQRDEISTLRHHNDTMRERIDRLTESLARKAGIDLVLPPPPLPPQPPQVPVSNPWKDPNPVTTNFKGATQ